MTSITAAISIASTTREIRLRMVWALCLTAASIVTIRAANDTSVTATQVNGTWATPAGEFKIWALDHHHLRVEFSVAAEHKQEPGPMVNAGDGHGIAAIQGNTAIFRPNGADAGLPNHPKVRTPQPCRHSD
jgi:hypothetical protein